MHWSIRIPFLKISHSQSVEQLPLGLTMCLAQIPYRSRTSGSPRSGFISDRAYWLFSPGATHSSLVPPMSYLSDFPSSLVGNYTPRQLVRPHLHFLSGTWVVTLGRVLLDNFYRCLLLGNPTGISHV
ncbi:hypothetical protein BHE74_00025701 [Ensete ventricosum]|nr:hypothetical protein GW17_00011392 [Ensete ventricosum]RWW66895.1 hypothetical protein BHE74_00025701 [Ensete ventricosum]